MQNNLQLDITIPNPQPAIFNLLLEENGFLQHSFSYELRDASVTSVGNIAKEEIAVSVYPNPMSKSTRFEVLDGTHETLTLQVYDMTGRSIYAQTVQQGTNQIQFNRGDIPAGMYFYQIQVDGQLLQADKLEIR